MCIMKTERLFLREMQMGDLDRLYELYEDAAARRYLEPLSEDRAEEAEKLKAYIDVCYSFYGFGYWAVCDRESGEMIGRCGFRVVGFDGEFMVDTGWLIDARYRGQGLAEEAVRAVLSFAEETLELDEVTACIEEGNDISERLAKRCGFVYDKEVTSSGRLYKLYRKQFDMAS